MSTSTSLRMLMLCLLAGLFAMPMQAQGLFSYAGNDDVEAARLMEELLQGIDQIEVRQRNEKTIVFFYDQTRGFFMQPSTFDDSDFLDRIVIHYVYDQGDDTRDGKIERANDLNTRYNFGTFYVDSDDDLMFKTQFTFQDVFTGADFMSFLAFMDFALNLLPDPNATPQVMNKTGYTLQLLNVSPGSATSWGENVLTTTLANNGTYVVDLSTNNNECGYDIRAQDTDGDVYIVAGHNFCNVPVLELTLANLQREDDPEPQPTPLPATVTVVNQTGQTIAVLNVSRDDSDSWGDELLGEETLLNPNGSFSVSTAAYGGHCTYDIRLVDTNRDQYITKHNFCENATLTVTTADKR